MTRTKIIAIFFITCFPDAGLFAQQVPGMVINHSPSSSSEPKTPQVVYSAQVRDDSLRKINYPSGNN